MQELFESCDRTMTSGQVIDSSVLNVTGQVRARLSATLTTQRYPVSHESRALLRPLQNAWKVHELLDLDKL